MNKAELIASLVTDKHSGFKEGDEPILEAASDARLEEFRSASDATRSAAAKFTAVETENKNISARLKVTEDKLRAAEQPLTKEDFLEKAPPEYKALLENHKAEEDALRASLVSQLKDLGANTESELRAMPIDQLRTLAKYARVPEPDFSGRGMPKQRDAESRQTYAPPDPYAAGIKALQEQQTKH